MLNRQQVLGLYLLWVLILFIEILYFFGIKDGAYNAVDLVFAVVVITVTLVIGAVDINVFKL